MSPQSDPNHGFTSPLISRRAALARCAAGFGAVAATALMTKTGVGATKGQLAPKATHFSPRVKSVIFLYMDGGPSQVDTFDYKPLLAKHDGEDPRTAIGKLEPTQFNNVGKVLKSPWSFARYGESGHWISSLFPHLCRHVDDLCIIKSMTSRFPEHTSANYFLHTGSGLQGRPSMGAWIGYGLGSLSENLPGFVVINGGLIPPGGLDNFNSGFLPASFQGSVIKPGTNPIANIQPLEATPKLQRQKLNFLRQLDDQTLARFGVSDQMESAIANQELAFRMQTAVPELVDVSSESAATQEMYGMNAPWDGTKTFARQCLLARRMVERGVRFVELTCPGGNGDRWDQHSSLKDGHEKNAVTIDQPIAALIADLKQRGLFDETLLVWMGEFGRTPFAQGSDGRDHNPFGFSMWMAGGGVKGGLSYGSTDDWGYKAIENKLEIHDLHATMLHLLGLDHTRTTFRFSSREMRLTDVHGHVIHDILT
ncbi:DUF1501 domain-containing protein [Planctomicrobium sp. SH661]|uniref:DUF1501 domain-containing protein n=1 Tax=Planctomicrobium sp. SH661 TaxID=3448124 RepID=UPI003F5B9341